MESAPPKPFGPKVQTLGAEVFIQPSNRTRTPLGQSYKANGPSLLKTPAVHFVFDQSVGEMVSFAPQDVDRMKYTIGSNTVDVSLRDSGVLRMALLNEHRAARVADHIVWSMVGPRREKRGPTEERYTLMVASGHH